MRRIKEFINKHTKLKRILTIFGIIGIILSFLFNAVIITSAIITANNEKISHPLVYSKEVLPVKNLASTGDTHYFINNGDLTFNTFYNNITDLYGESAEYTNDSTLSFNTSNNSITLDRIDFNYFESDLLEDSYTSLTITQIAFSKVIFNDNDRGRFVEYTYLLYTNQASTYVIIRFEVYTDVTYFGSSVSPFITTNIFIRQNGDDYKIYDYYFLLYAVTQKGFIYDTFVRNSDKGYVNGYVDGYATGLTTGKDVGYAVGYQDGIDYAEAHSMTSDPFTLISRAFSSVASILNIEVLPNLTLGVLIFTPLIVTIIVVVVKFMRG